MPSTVAAVSDAGVAGQLPDSQTLVWSSRLKINAFESEAGAKLGANFGSPRQARKRKAPLCGAFAVAGAGI
jgi:hypothetical protein